MKTIVEFVAGPAIIFSVMMLMHLTSLADIVTCIADILVILALSIYVLSRAEGQS